MLRALSVLGFFAFAIAMSACERNDAAVTVDSAVAAHSDAAPPVPTTRQAVDASPEPAPVVLPARGRFAIRVSDAGVSVAANEAPLAPLLEALGAKLEFKVNIAASFNPRKATLSVSDEAVELVLARLLKDAPYTLRFDLNEIDERTTLAALNVGPQKTRTKLERRTARRETNRERRTNISPADREAARLERQQAAQERFERQPEYLADLESHYPEQRARGLEGLDIEEQENFDRAADMLLNDPDASVREAAAEALSLSDSSATIETLMGALDDPDPDVVITTLGELAFLGDAALVPRVHDVTVNHPDPIVREYARDIEYFLSD